MKRQPTHHLRSIFHRSKNQVRRRTFHLKIMSKTRLTFSNILYILGKAGMVAISGRFLQKILETQILNFLKKIF